MLVCYDIPEITDTFFRIPFALEGPFGSDGLVIWLAIGLIEVVVEPS